MNTTIKEILESYFRKHISEGIDKANDGHRADKVESLVDEAINHFREGLKRNNPKPKPKPLKRTYAPRKRKWKLDAHEDKIRWLASKGRSVRDIAKSLGVSHSTVSLYMIKHNIKTRKLVA